MKVSEFLSGLPADVKYAIERGLPEIDQALVSDLDIVITKNGFRMLYASAVEKGLLLFATLSYGGVRLFLASSSCDIKRIDCMWNCNYLGIPICSVSKLLNVQVRDAQTSLFVLNENMQAEVAFAVKNARGGAEKYRVLLERNDLEVLSAGARRHWLVKQVVKHPLATLTGVPRLVLAYAIRILFPSGVSVFGVSARQLTQSDVLTYLFQGRIREAALIEGFMRSRFGSELCIVKSVKQADIDLSGMQTLQAIEQEILAYLRESRTGLPSLVIAGS